MVKVGFKWSGQENSIEIYSCEEDPKEDMEEDPKENYSKERPSEDVELAYKILN